MALSPHVTRTRKTGWSEYGERQETVVQPARSYAPLKCGSPERDSEGWLCVKDLNKTEAEQLLDWLEANGLCRRTVSFQADGKFLVRWRPAETK